MGQNLYAELMPNRARFESVRRKDIRTILTTKSCRFEEVKDFSVADIPEAKIMISQTHQFSALL
jgi:hypothetical protein